MHAALKDVARLLPLHLQVGNLKDVYHFLKPVEGHDRLKSVSGLPVQESYTRRLQAEENVRLLWHLIATSLNAILVQVMFVEQQERKKRFKKTGYSIPNDPNWSDQWSLVGGRIVSEWKNTDHYHSGPVHSRNYTIKISRKDSVQMPKTVIVQCSKCIASF